MVLVTTGRSSWSLVNGLLAVVVNVGLDVLLIPRYGIIGAAIGWSAAIVLTNLLPLAQVAATVPAAPIRPRHLHRHRIFRLVLRRAATYRARTLRSRRHSAHCSRSVRLCCYGCGHVAFSHRP